MGKLALQCASLIAAMENKPISKSNKKIALILGLVAVIWYVASMFTIWK
jgi:hypothetical protein